MCNSISYMKESQTGFMHGISRIGLQDGQQCIKRTQPLKSMSVSFIKVQEHEVLQFLFYNFVYGCRRRLISEGTSGELQDLDLRADTLLPLCSTV